ncbi:intimin-like adhesin FdeC [Escherichia coli]|jgi:adhesin/invasin|uniref:invasin domain 3-containing protein n=1 Tax=Escherichia marmotae TaxID=1499973 RepID=UPI002E21653F|nr:intimin-like adhesin FdeC [Escherichia coli]MEC9911756.1 invasin domain 3-containing protein [Escherichia marmotae]MEC9931845.1 invasin domain 3-containing protein [Escherichia marmotae]MED8752762.1 invasin domain 3-containing protein [Escherichia marmotae]MED9341535.1 invasin domain 3-containing protein [Escherichia marmotae]
MSRLKKAYKQPRFRYSALAHCVAWANISIQVLFPLAVTFTPTMTARAHNAALPRLSTENTAVATDNNADKNIASFAANAGKFLSSQPDSDATRNFVTGMATAKATQEIQEWLGKYGTARVKLNADKDFSLKDSSLEMLYPIYDTPTDMLFTQGAIHRTDDRTQSNIGFGWRHFSGNDWMAGLNTFIDHDLSRSHTRIGVGAEYWRDYLKLSANGYIRASGWKKSPDIEDYQERPANGWDIRAEGYLPAWPQLGASLMYEQYYGDEVGLFGKDKRQKDPHAISAEVNYTPVPLLTLSAEHKQGKSGQNDTRFGLEVNYRIGEPLEKQLDTDSIRERRVLAGSRYDLVERNNNIVLEYRKAEVIRIALPDRIEGKGGQTVSLGLVVSKATHGLKNVQWEAPSLLAAGGKITGQGNQWQVTLPAYRAGKDNYYAISAVAYDNKGNASKRVQTAVVITGAGMSADRTTLTLDGQSRIQMLANGSAQKPLVLSLRDAEGQPITGMKDQIKTELTFKPAGNIVTRALKSAKSQAQPTLGEITETEAGVYKSVFTTGTQSGEATITVSVDGMSKTVTAELRATMMDVTKSTLSVNETSGDVIADGQKSYTLTLTAVDTDGNPVEGEASRLRFVPQDNSGVTIGTISEIKPGVYSATVSSTRAGNIVVRAFSEQYQLGTLQQTLKFVAGPLDAARSTITLNPDKPVVGGTLTVTWAAKDAYDNPVTGLTPDTPSLTGAAAAGSSVSGWTDNGDGTWIAQISLGTTAGELIVMPKINGQDAAANAAKVTVVADALSSGQSKVSVAADRIKAGESTTVTLVAKDAHGNAISGLSLSASLTGAASEGATVSSWTEKGDGSYVATLTTGGKTGDLHIMPLFNGQPAATDAAQLTVVAGDQAVSNSTLTVKDSVLAVESATELTFSARDQFGNALTDIDTAKLGVSLSGDAASGSSVTGWSHKGNGEYTAILRSGTRAGALNIMPQIDGKNATAKATPINVKAGTVSVDHAEMTVSKTSITVGESVTLTLTMTDKYGNAITGITPETPQFGGDAYNINQQRPSVSQWTDKGNGTYTAVLTAGATGVGELTIMPRVDGSDALKQAVSVTIAAGEMSLVNSTFVADNDAPMIKTTTQLIFTAKDANGNPVRGLKPDAPEISGAASTGTEQPSAGAWTEQSDGTYVTTLTIGSAAGQLVIWPRVNGKDAASQPLLLNVVGNASEANIHDISVNVDNQLADGQSANKVTLTVTDSYGNPLQDQTVTLTLPEGVSSKTGNKVTTNAAGKADIELISTVAGEHKITASVKNSQKTATVKFKADAKTGQASLQVDTAQKAANGNDAFTLTATVEDKHGNPVPGTMVAFNLPRGVTPLNDESTWVKTNDEGKAELRVVSVVAGTYAITATAGNDQTSDAQSITFVADKATATISNIEVIGNRALADGKAKQTYKVTVTDANNNIVKDSEVTLSAEPATLDLEPNGTATTNEQGQAVFTASTTKAAIYTLTAKVNRTDGQVSTKTAESRFVADDKNAVLAVSPERVESLVADGVATATLEITLMSADNPVGGSMWVDIQAPEGVTEDDYQFLPSKADHFVSGKITRKFSTTKPGVYTFTFNTLTYGGYEMQPVTVTINAVEAATEEGEEAIK